jgi:hypothetical protein
MVRWWWYGSCRLGEGVGLFPDFFPLSLGLEEPDQRRWSERPELSISSPGDQTPAIGWH